MAEIVKKKILQEARNPGRGVIESEVFDASRRARSIVQDAEAKAQEILAQAHAEASRVLQEAQDQGYQMGEAKGLKQYQESVVRMNREYDELLGQAESQLLNLAVGVARKIIDKELMVNPRVMVDIVRRALAPMNRKRSIVLRINPADRAALNEHRADLLETMLAGGNIVFMNDPNISRGGCMIETEHGTVDARLETQLSTLNQILTGRREIIEIKSPTYDQFPAAEITQEAPSESQDDAAWTTPAEADITHEEIVHHPVVEEPVYEAPVVEEHTVEEEVDAALEAVAPAPANSTDSLMKEMEALSQGITSEEDLNALISSLDEFLDKGHE